MVDSVNSFGKCYRYTGMGEKGTPVLFYISHCCLTDNLCLSVVQVMVLEELPRQSTTIFRYSIQINGKVTGMPDPGAKWVPLGMKVKMFFSQSPVQSASL